MTRSAAAQIPPAVELSSASPAASLERARALYLEGLKLVREAHWGEALAAFEGSYALRPHPLTTFNIGACERALARYTRAQRQFARALSPEAVSELPPSVVEDARAFSSEIARLLVHIRLLVEPAGAAISVDGRPLARAERGSSDSLVAGILPAGAGTPAPKGWFEIVADPGVHVITVSRRGYADVLINGTYAPGRIAEHRLELTRLPATIRVSSNEIDALVNVNGKDVGPVPVDVRRSAGLYRVEVSKTGFVPYVAEVRVNAGEQSALRANLVREKSSWTSKWWFWTGAVALVGGVVTATYIAARNDGEPARPALDGGSLGWIANIP